MKVRTGISMESDLLSECDRYCVDNDISRSDLIEKSVRLYLATRAITDKTDVLVPELAECIAKASDDGIVKISKGLFRYAVEVEMLITILRNTFEISSNEFKTLRREAINNVRRTRGRINLEHLLVQNVEDGIGNDDGEVRE
ncbi:MAG: hypothetical protein IJ555_06000 [Ruminococcus sp.]|nr:hypothetical protein [Ruminococcus sp.]